MFVQASQIDEIIAIVIDLTRKTTSYQEVKEIYLHWNKEKDTWKTFYFGNLDSKAAIVWYEIENLANIFDFRIKSGSLCLWKDHYYIMTIKNHTLDEFLKCKNLKSRCYDIILPDITQLYQ